MASERICSLREHCSPCTGRKVWALGPVGGGKLSPKQQATRRGSEFGWRQRLVLMPVLCQNIVPSRVSVHLHLCAFGAALMRLQTARRTPEIKAIAFVNKNDALFFCLFFGLVCNIQLKRIKKKTVTQEVLLNVSEPVFFLAMCQTPPGWYDWRCVWCL